MRLLSTILLMFLSTLTFATSDPVHAYDPLEITFHNSQDQLWDYTFQQQHNSRQYDIITRKKDIKGQEVEAGDVIQFIFVELFFLTFAPQKSSKINQKSIKIVNTY